MKLWKSLVVALAAAALLAAGETPRPAGELSFTAIDGREVSLAGLKGKAVLVMYFSTDCPHCQHTAEVLGPIYSELRGKGFEIVGLAMNPGAKGNIRAFVSKHQVAFPVGFADRPAFSKFSGLSVMERFYFPYLIFVNQNGVVLEERQGSDRRYFADLNGNLRQSIAALFGS